MSEQLRVFPNQRTTVEHYPIAPGCVIVRWRGGDDPDDRGYIVEANIGGVIMEGAGHYGSSLHTAREAGERISAALLTRPNGSDRRPEPLTERPPMMDTTSDSQTKQDDRRSGLRVIVGMLPSYWCDQWKCYRCSGCHQTITGPYACKGGRECAAVAASTP